MQNRYAGDIGDFVKLALLRHLSKGRKLGIAWYLYPDEGHNADGKHTSYLQAPQRWRHLDPELFDALAPVVANGRSVRDLEATGAIDGRFSRELLTTSSIHWQSRASWRTDWFSRVVTDLRDADIVFADPDNGLVDDNPRRRSKKVFGKQMPLTEATALADGRTAVIYHHNTRRAGGHDAEVDYWIDQLGEGTIAVRATAYSCRTFFVLNADEVIAQRAASFCYRWANHSVRLHRQA
ncbi:hypothetical protein SAZ10_13200 [Mesorhizobium sp. BAC0120]|uniref:hypothetical protein n=1 Tax=Mesorhizobium sp. BAC0120 TaxID=3090670 RepID=UPI00298C077C|nr:hypothetical protein [Mesorhizobium sp. BAC0120]MDW6022713.1 hypothetical protein [Mesorhizobium sp. BAC0120]